MIILHDPMSGESRNFVDSHGAGHTVVTPPDAATQYPFVSAYPSVLIQVPAYYDAAGDRNIRPHDRLMRAPADMTAPLAEQAAVDQRAVDNPPQEGKQEYDPSPVVPQRPGKRIRSKLEFVSLFTLAEVAEVETSQNDLVVAIRKQFDAAEEIDLISPLTEMGLAGLVQAGVLTSDRAGQILAGQEPAEEES